MTIQPYSIHIAIFFSTFLFFMIPINDAQAYSNFDPETDFYIVMTIPIVFNTVNYLGTLYIFYRTYLRWKYDNKRISLSFKFPFYIAVVDFFYSSSILIEYAYAVTRKSEFIINNEIITWPHFYCEILGFFIVFFVILSLLLVGAISVVTWLRVVREYYFELGKFDYKIWVPVISISSIVNLSTAYVNGPRNYSCGPKVGYDIVEEIFLVLVIAILITIVFCYASVLRTIRRVKEDNFSVTNSYNNSTQLARIERRTLKKILTYILIFILQYIPILIYDVLAVLQIHYVIADSLASAVLSFGGIGNLIQYLCNEGFKYQPSSSNISSSVDKLEADEQQSNNTNNTTIMINTNDIDISK